MASCQLFVFVPHFLKQNMLISQVFSMRYWCWMRKLSSLQRHEVISKFTMKAISNQCYKRSRFVWNVFYTWFTCSQTSSLKLCPTTFQAPTNNIQYENISYSYVISGQHLLVKRMKRFGSYLLWILWFMWDICQSVIRIIELGCVLFPLFLMYPLAAVSFHVRDFWYQTLLFGLQFMGPIFVKLGQWASTRRDVFPNELCSHLATLQRRTTPHSWYYTRKTLERAYGPEWKKIFIRIENDRQPIGSGCCAQVYKAWIKSDALTSEAVLTSTAYDCSENSYIVEGLEVLGVGYLLGALDRNNVDLESNHEGLDPVAVKVLHPRMETLLRRDLRILKALAIAITWAIPSLKWLSLSECVEDFSQLMKSQVNFCKEALNLETFTTNFKGVDTVKFPRPIWSLTTPYLLIETYEEGEHMQHYVSSNEAPLIKRQLAEVGINTILSMVFEHNFAHGDLHPGNILVQKVSPLQSNSFFKMMKPTVMPFKLVILDCGIVATLDARGKKCLSAVFAAVANGDGERVAELFLAHSNHQCEDENSFKQSMKEIVDGALSKNVTLQQVEVATLMTSLFSTMIKHRVKLDSSFSSVILAIMVLEGLGRSLDPTIDVVEKAKPFLFNVM